MKKSPHRDRIGVTTGFMQSDSETDTLWDALDMACVAGFKAIEITPSDCNGHSGWPRTRFCVGFNLDSISARERDRLAASVSRFPTRAVHAISCDLNIASRNRGIARESLRQYMQCAQLAVDIGARTVTFHAGHASSSARVGDGRFEIERNVEFGKEMAEFCEQHDLVAGFENGGSYPPLAAMCEIIEQIGSPRFGFHLDTGHAWLGDTKDPAKWARELSGHVVALHVHGTFHRPDRTFENHMGLELDDCTDFPALFEELDGGGFDGPIILELIARDIATYIDMSTRSRDLLATWCRLGEDEG